MAKGGSSPKRKGSNAEREFVNLYGGRRAWGSDGRSLGLPEGVDVTESYHGDVQVKSRKALPKWMQIPEGCDCVAIRVHGGRWYKLEALRGRE